MAIMLALPCRSPTSSQNISWKGAAWSAKTPACKPSSFFCASRLSGTSTALCESRPSPCSAFYSKNAGELCRSPRPMSMHTRRFCNVYRVRLVSLAAQKFIAGALHDAAQVRARRLKQAPARLKEAGWEPKDKRATLLTEDLAQALAEVRAQHARPPAHGPTLLFGTCSTGQQQLRACDVGNAGFFTVSTSASTMLHACCCEHARGSWPCTDSACSSSSGAVDTLLNV